MCALSCWSCRARYTWLFTGCGLAWSTTSKRVSNNGLSHWEVFLFWGMMAAVIWIWTQVPTVATPAIYHWAIPMLKKLISAVTITCRYLTIGCILPSTFPLEPSPLVHPLHLHSPELYIDTPASVRIRLQKYWCFRLVQYRKCGTWIKKLWRI